MSADDDGPDQILTVNAETLDASKIDTSTQLEERRIRARAGIGLLPPYNPDRLAAYMETNETHSVSVRKKARYEVGFGFDLVPAEGVDPDDASEAERDTADDFWRSEASRWQTGPHQSAEPTTPVEVLELARQDYHAIGWAALEILTNNMGDPTGLAHVPANTVRVRKPPEAERTEEVFEGDLDDDPARGYLQVRQGRRRYFGEAGDRYADPPVFVDIENGDVAEGSAEQLPNGPANELIFVRNPSPLTLHYGIPDWISAIRTIAADEAAKDYNRQFFDNDTIPRMVVTVSGGELSEESKRDLTQMLHGLRDEAHRAVVLEVEKFNEAIGEDVEIEIEPIGQGISEEMDFREFRRKNEHEIAKVHEVPPILIGVTDTSNRANSREQVHAFATEVIKPEQHKFAERLYQVIHQTALGVTDWTIEFDLRGADQPMREASIANQRIQASDGTMTVDEARAEVGKDPLPDDHAVDGETLLANLGGGDGGFFSQGRHPHAPPEENKIGEREWSEVKAELERKLAVEKVPIETQTFDSSNLDEGLFDFGENTLFISFLRDEGSDSLYAYTEVPTSEWSGLVNAGSHGSYHYSNIRLSYPYIEITNFHSRLPEGQIPEDPPEGVPSEI